MAVDDPIPAVRIESAAAAPQVADAAAEHAPAAAAIVAAAPELAPVVAVELVGERPSLLETIGKEPAKPAAEVKPAEAAKPEEPKDLTKETAPKAEDTKKTEAKADTTGEKPAEPEKAPLAPVEYKYELPPTLKVDDALKAEMHTAFDAFRANPAEGAQALIDLHNKVVTDLVAQNATETLRGQHKSFNDTRTQWNKDWAADEQIGGAGYQTALRAVARMRDQFVSAELPGSPKHEADRKSFEEFLRVTGAGDHPAFGRFLHNVARAFDEPALPPQNGRPPPSNGLKPGSKRERMYDHPSSSKTS